MANERTQRQIDRLVDGAEEAFSRATPLLETKLYIPKWRPGLVARSRLIERLEQGIQRQLTLISAPPGFGKSTMLAEWVAATPAGERPAAWLSLDQSDNDPVRFWAYFIGALQKIDSAVGGRALSLLQSPQPPTIESVLTSLINEVNADRGRLRSHPRRLPRDQCPACPQRNRVSS